MITLMKLERSLSSKQLVRSCAAASCPTQPSSRTPSTAARPAARVTSGRGSGPGGDAGWPQESGTGHPGVGALAELWAVEQGNFSGHSGRPPGPRT